MVADQQILACGLWDPVTHGLPINSMKICKNFVIEINPASCDSEQDFLQNFAEESFSQEILEG